MKICNRSRSVLVKHDITEDTVDFRYDDPDWARNTQVLMDIGLWEDMGGPEEITITIEPGDLLNVD